jgi:EAL and modified HD-GYP domain-containing signal transduction protein
MGVSLLIRFPQGKRKGYSVGPGDLIGVKGMQMANVVRQPIFDHEYQVIAYELLFHRLEGEDVPGCEKTAGVIANSLMNIGLAQLTGNKPAYINFSREMVMDGTALLLPPGGIGIELPGSEPVDADMLSMLRQMKRKGYAIVLDHFEYDADKRPLLELASLIKVDVQACDDISGTLRALRPYAGRLLAEKVETYAQHEWAKAAGFTMFQGYFFCRPQTVAGKQLPDSKLAVMQALKEISRSDSIHQLNQVISHDMELSYKLLRYINSSAFGFRRRIGSIEQALNLLGMDNIRRWLTVLSMASLGEDKPLELVRQAMLRGKLMEEIARLLGLPRLPEYFVLGMFSLLDGLLDQPLDTALQEIVLPETVRQGLFEPDSQAGRMLGLLRDTEQADWLAIADGCHALALNVGDVMVAHLEAARWLEEYSAMLTET